MRRLARWVYLSAGIGLAAAATAGCRADRTEWRAMLTAMRADRLTGAWVARLQLDKASGDTLPSPVISGEIALTLNAQRLEGPGFDAPPTYFGSYDIAFDELGPRAVVERGPPTVVGMLRRGDTLDLRLAPGHSQRIELTGRLEGDSVLGRWRASQPRGIDATGDFVLRRR